MPSSFRPSGSVAPTHIPFNVEDLLRFRPASGYKIKNKWSRKQFSSFIRIADFQSFIFYTDVLYYFLRKLFLPLKASSFHLIIFLYER
jgi:hypothetical protein